MKATVKQQRATALLARVNTIRKRMGLSVARLREHLMQNYLSPEDHVSQLSVYLWLHGKQLPGTESTLALVEFCDANQGEAKPKRKNTKTR